MKNVEEQLKTAITERVNRVVPPPADIDAVLPARRGKSRVRLVAVPAAAATLATGVIGGSAVWTGDGEGAAQAGPLGKFDFSEGLRAYMSPDNGGSIHIAGREFDAKRLNNIDTDATATPFGMVYFDDNGQAHLLDEAGYRKAIGPIPETPPGSSADDPTQRLGPSVGDMRGKMTAHMKTTGAEGFRPTSATDASTPVVAWTEYYGDHVTVRLHDLSKRQDVATRDVPCENGCAGVRIAAVDNGVVFVDTGDGTYMWEQQKKQGWTRVAGADTEVVDVRGGTILYDGARPDGLDSSWRLARGSIDAKLTFDGRYILDWSRMLQPTRPGDDPVRVDAPRSASFYAIDTDGSVLAATSENPARVFDCSLGSGDCSSIGSVSTANGDPIFVGADN